jgi:hypothetical protein
VSKVAAKGPEGCRRLALATSFAPIQLTLPETAGFDVNARTALGRIRSGLPLGPGPVSSAFVGPIRGGGCPITLANRSGDIVILGGPTERSANAAPARPVP